MRRESEVRKAWNEAFLREHPDVSDKIEAEIRANAHKLMSPQARKAAIASGRAVEVAADDFQG